MRPQRPCKQPHGTITRYSAGCSCIPCCDAKRQYEADRKQGKIASGRVSPDKVVAHIHELYRSMTFSAIADSSGISVDVIKALHYGKRTYVHAETEAAILEVAPAAPMSSTSLVSLEPSAALVTRMRKRHSTTEIAEAVGLPWRHLRSIQTGYRGKRWVYASTAKKIEEAAVKLGTIRRVETPNLVLVSETFDEIVASMGWEPEAIMSAAGVPNDAYQHIRRGRPVGEDRAERVAFALGASVDRLFEAVA